MIIRIAHEEKVYGLHLALFEAVGRMAPHVLGRAAGLLGHLAEEPRHPIASDIHHSVDRDAHYVAGDTGQAP